MYYPLISVCIYEIIQSTLQGFINKFLILAVSGFIRRKVRLRVGRKVISPEFVWFYYVKMFEVDMTKYEELSVIGGGKHRCYST